MDRREHIRFYFSLPMDFQVKIQDSEELWESRATLKNISQGGLYFECETAPQLKRGNVAEFTFTTKPPKYSFIDSPIKAQAVIKRIERQIAGSSNYGIALQFTSKPFAI